MGALKLPTALSIASASKQLCARIGVRVNGEDMGNRVVAYDVVEGWARIADNTVRRGTIEPYWR
jgi:hypothetical protein